MPGPERTAARGTGRRERPEGKGAFTHQGTFMLEPKAEKRFL